MYFANFLQVPSPSQLTRFVAKALGLLFQGLRARGQQTQAGPGLFQVLFEKREGMTWSRRSCETPLWFQVFPSKKTARLVWRC